MTISRDDVLTIARLAKLELDDDTVQSMTKELDSILGYIDQLAQVDTSDVPPTAQVTVEAAPLRADEPRAGVAKREALDQAPRSDQVGFLVPEFVDES